MLCVQDLQGLLDPSVPQSALQPKLLMLERQLFQRSQEPLASPGPGGPLGTSFTPSMPLLPWEAGASSMQMP